MNEYKNQKQSGTSSDPNSQGVNLEKNSGENQPYDYQNSQNGIDGFPLQGSQNHQNGDYVTPGYDNSNHNYISQNSLSGKDENAKNLAIVSLICGIIALLMGCCCGCFSFPISIVGIITGFMSNYDNGQKDKMAIAGIICSIISLLLVMIIIVFGVATGTTTEFLNSF